MTVDITALASVVRRFDMSATLKSFFAVLAPLVVVSNVSTILIFLRDTFALDAIFAEGRILIRGFVLAALLASFAPLAFLVSDWWARQDSLRHLSAMVGGAIGAVAFWAIGFALSLGCSILITKEVKVDLLGASPRLIVGVLAALGFVSSSIWLVSGSKSTLQARLTLTILAGVLAAFLGPFVWFAIQEVTTEGEGGLSASLLLATLVICWIIRLVKARVVLSADVPRALLLGDVTGGFWVRSAFLIGLPSSLWYVAALSKPATWGFLVARPVLYLGATLPQQGIVQQHGWTIALTLGAAVIAVGHFSFYVAKRLAAREIWRPIDQRNAPAPILFLRSFEDDQLEFRRPVWDVVGRWFDLWSFRRNADEAMIDEVARYGPVVALGQPGELRAPFGAMRHYSAHEDWQAVVTETAWRAKAIVIAAGSSAGVLWEYELLKNEGLLDRTLLLFRPADDGDVANQKALAAFQRMTGAEQSQIPDDCQPVALLPTERGAVLLVAQRATASAYIVALRAYFQRCGVERLQDPVYSGR